MALTPIMKPKSNCLPGHRFPLQVCEEHMNPITVLLSQHTVKVKPCYRAHAFHPALFLTVSQRKLHIVFLFAI